MKVVIIGASGNVGSFIRDEALARGHQVTAIVRHPEKITVKNPRLTVIKGDILADDLAKLVKGHDAVISAYNPGWTNPNMYDDQMKASRALIEGVKKSGVKRLLIVGGASSLEVSPGVRLFDTVQFPEPIRGGVLGVIEELNMLRGEKELEWTFLSPPQNLVKGERTGHYRLGKDQIVKDAKGESKISTADLAVAMIDELEKPKHIRQRFTVAY